MEEEITDLQKEIHDMYSRDRKYLMWGIVIIAVIVLIVLFKLFYGTPAPDMFKDDQQVKVLKDSMEVRDKRRDGQYKILQQKYLGDSIRLSGLQRQINNVPDMISKIDKKYDEKRKVVSIMSVDEQFDFFTNWLSSTDSL